MTTGPPSVGAGRGPVPILEPANRVTGGAGTPAEGRSAWPPQSGGRLGPLSAWVVTTCTVALIVVALAQAVIVGADCLWLVAVGDGILAHRSVPDGIPFAAAPTHGWPNVLVAAEVLLALIHRAGDSALAFMQVVVDAVMLVLLALGCRRQRASDRATATVLGLVTLGALTSLVIVRVQTLSLVPFAVLLLLCRREWRSPSRRVWWLPVLVAVWSNLHGAVLVAVVVAGTYLVFSRLRLRRLETLLVGVATLLALLANPAGLRTVGYYTGVMTNEAATRGSELWARPSVSSPFDVLMMAAAFTLVVLFARSRPPLWECVTALGLVLATSSSARHGLWLLMFVAAPAARGLTRRPVERVGTGLAPLARIWGTLALVLVILTTSQVGSHRTLPADDELVTAVQSVAGTRVVLAPEPLAESLAVVGVRLWVSDPVDAFTQADQAAYLDFLQGSPDGRAAVDQADIVVVKHGTPSARLVERVPGLGVAARSGDWVIYLRP